MRFLRLLKLAGINKEFIVKNHKVNSLKTDSRNVKNNDVFFAIKGVKNDGRSFVNEAIKNGAKTIIYEGEIDKDFYDINYIKVENIKSVLALCAKIYYKDITKKVNLIGITGTNGKTTVSSLLSDFLGYSGHDVLLIGTNGIYVKDEHYHSTNTTPDIIMIYDAIKYSFKKGIKTVVIEVSSIGIREARLLYFDFNIVVFTNLLFDHLDYHKNITDYKFSKALVMWGLEFRKNNALVLNIDDENYSFFAGLSKSKIITYGVEKEADFNAIKIKKSINGTEFNIIKNGNTYRFNTNLIGGFNVYNILAVICVISFLKFNVEDFSDFLKIYAAVSGRMNKILYKNKTIIIDFAHTTSGVVNVLTNIKQFSNYKICVVIGCGGNRDVIKRSEIGEVSVKFADRVIFTSDNPRDEEPEKIIDDMISKIKNKEYKNYEIIIDRKEAILNALNHSNLDEIIVILGKGSEKEQLIKGIQYPFSDKKVVYDWIKSNEKY